MPKKLTGLLLVGSLAFMTSGCNGDISDIDNQLSKMNNIIISDNLFDQDYMISVNKEIIDGNKISVLNYTTKRDKNLLYIEIYKDYAGSESIVKFWVDEGENEYFTYLDDGNNKLYSVHNDKEGAISKLDNKEVNILYDLRNVYNNIYQEMQDYSKKCDFLKETKIVCSVEKTLFGKVSFKTEVKEVSGNESYITYVLKKGKMKKAINTTNFNGIKTSSIIEFNYGNQKIDLPDRESYVNE